MWIQSTGAVTGLDNGTCTVTLTLSKTGYADKTNEYTLTINEGVIAQTGWGTYGTVTVGAGGNPCPTKLPILTPVMPQESYSTTNSLICSVNPTGTGAVTGIDGGTCGVRLDSFQDGLWGQRRLITP